MNTTDTIPGLDEDIPGQMTMTRVIPPGEDLLHTITKLGDRLVQLLEKHEQVTNDLEELEAQIKQVSETQLPDLLASVGLTQLRMASGRTIGTKTDYHAAISKANAERAYAWLKENNMGGIIKENLLVKPDQRERLMRAGVNFDTSASVHPSTLRALVKEQIEAGTDFPRELFGVFVANRVVVL
jgi:hypothetical protein